MSAKQKATTQKKLAAQALIVEEATSPHKVKEKKRSTHRTIK